MMTLVVFPSSSHESRPPADAEDRIARLTDAAYQVALEHGLTGSFVELQLEIWSAIRGVIEEEESSVEDLAREQRVPARLQRII